jgi:predicted acyl esterase
MRFLEQWLRGVDTGVTREPPVKLAIRHGGERYVWRYENEWPIARTQWTPYYLDGSDGSLSARLPVEEAAVRFSAEADAENTAVTFVTAPFEEETEVTGPIKLKLWVSSTIDDGDLFCIIHNIAPDGQEVTYGTEPAGYRCGVRLASCVSPEADPARSTPYRPYRDELQKLEEEIVPWRLRCGRPVSSSRGTIAGLEIG